MEFANYLIFAWISIILYWFLSSINDSLKDITEELKRFNDKSISK